MDAHRYTMHYNSLADSGSDFVRMLWRKLLDAYIIPNGPREVNLPSDVRDRLLSLPFTHFPPHPSELEPAVKIIYELMDESVLVPFLNSSSPTRAPESLSLWGSDESMIDSNMATLAERSLSPSHARTQREASPPLGGDLNQSPGLSPRISHHPHLGRVAPSRLSTLISSPSATSSAEAFESMTDDGTDSPSPSGSALEPMTPPTTPPTSSISFKEPSPSSSHTVRPEGSGWKKMGAKLGWKKSRSGPSSSSRYPLGRGGSDDSRGSGL